MAHHENAGSGDGDGDGDERSGKMEENVQDWINADTFHCLHN